MNISHTLNRKEVGEERRGGEEGEEWRKGVGEERMREVGEERMREVVEKWVGGEENIKESMVINVGKKRLR